MTQPADKPPERPTTKIEESEILKGLLRNLEKLVSDGFATTEARFDKTDANIELVSSAQKNTQEELRLFKEATGQKFAAIDGRADTASLRVRGVSQEGLESAARVAAMTSELEAEKARTKALEAQMVTKDDLAKATANQTSALIDELRAVVKKPLVRKIGLAFAGLVFVAINALTTYLTNVSHRETIHEIAH